MKMKVLLILLVFALTLAGCTPGEAGHTTGGTPGFSVEGTVLYDANGNPFVMRGINYPHTWFKDRKTVALPAIAATGSNTVRIVLSNGVQWSRDCIDTVEWLIEMCRELEMIAVLEVHDATGSDKIEDLMAAVEYWIDIKDVLIGNEAYVIVNIANEWYGGWNSRGWAAGYEQAIPALREAGIRNTLMVDAAGWGQFPQSIHQRGRRVFEADELANTIFSIHMYEYAGADEATVRENIDKVSELDLVVLVGEFGHRHYDGEVDFIAILAHSEYRNTGYLGWSWKGNYSGVAYLDIALDWAGERLSEDWGEILVNHPQYGIRATSTKATVFEY
jgi:mannan endo-1,4-beta-mannosidase